MAARLTASRARTENGAVTVGARGQLASLSRSRWNRRSAARLALAALVAGGLACRPRERPAAAPVEQAAQRVIALAPSTAEVVCAIGAADRLVAVGRYCTFPPAIAKLPKIGGLRDPDLESILALRPDLLMLRGRTPAVERLCREHGIAIYDDPTETLTDIERAVTEIGALLGLTDSAAQVVAEMRADLAAMRAAVEGRPRPRVLLTTRGPDQLANIYTVSNGSYLDELIALAGGDNVFGDQGVPYPMVGLEDIVARRPEVIIESLFGAVDGPALHRAVIEQWRSAGDIPAVASGRIHVLSRDYATIPSPRVVRMAADLVEMIHPEVVLESR